LRALAAWLARGPAYKGAMIILEIVPAAAKVQPELDFGCLVPKKSISLKDMLYRKILMYR
jgi:hypothetical protein